MRKLELNIHGGKHSLSLEEEWGPNPNRALLEKRESEKMSCFAKRMQNGNQEDGRGSWGTLWAGLRPNR